MERDEADPGEDLVGVRVGHVPHDGDAAGHERRDARRGEVGTERRKMRRSGSGWGREEERVWGLAAGKWELGPRIGF